MMKMFLNNNNPIGISQEITANSRKKVKQARILLILNLVVYTGISLAEMIVGHADHTTALIADGQNNLTGIISVLSLIVGLTFAIKPSDSYHLEGHWQFENLAVFLSGLIMFLVGLVCIWNGSTKIMTLVLGEQTIALKGTAAIMAAISALVMVTLSLVNQLISRKLHSAALNASARDFLSDALTSTGTMIAIAVAAIFRINWIDPLAAIILGGFIVYNGCRILSASAEKLSDGFSTIIRTKIIRSINSMSDVQAITFVNCRYSGSNIIVEAEIVLSDLLSLQQAYGICQRIQKELEMQYPILYCCIQVKPSKKSMVAIEQPAKILFNRF
ncbi:cation diffusion facilitator family transporter [Agrilactobacillus composti]|nr:cation diffusion facilitator family transporter [Agrilactobacillus composti]